jgi:hypothetical protein
LLLNMLGLRQFIRSRRSSAVLSACLAYALALQALVASVGVGMSAFATPEPAGFVICSHAFTGAPASDNHGQKPGSAPECPFCLVAAQCAGHMGFAGQPQAFPAHMPALAARIADLIRDGVFVPQFRRLAGGPRAPPDLSV